MAATALSRPVPTNYWLRPDISNKYTLDDKLLYIYLITNVHFQQHAIYMLPRNIMVAELGMEKERFDIAFDRLQNVFKVIDYSDDTNEIVVLDYFDYGILKGGKPLKDCFSHLGKKIHNMKLLKALYDRSKGFIDDRDSFVEVMAMIRNFLGSINMLDEEEQKAYDTCDYDRLA